MIDGAVPQIKIDGAAGYAISAAGIASQAAEAAIHVTVGSLSGAVNASIAGGDIGQSALIGGLSAGTAKYFGGGPYDSAKRILIGSAMGGISSAASGGDFFQGAYQGAWTSTISIVADSIVEKMTYEELRLAAKRQNGVLECIRPTDPTLIPGNHSYLYDEESGEGYGMAGMYGIVSGHHTERGPDKDVCFYIDGADGQGQDMLKAMRVVADKGPWIPSLSDCYIKSAYIIQQFGLKSPNPIGRLENLPSPGRYAPR